MTTKKNMPLLDTPVTGRVCWSCRHLYFDGGSPGWSELTPGTSFDMFCRKGFWRFDSYGEGLTHFRDHLLSAEKCADFTPHEAPDGDLRTS